MIYNFSDQPSVVNQFIYELRDEEIQKDRLRFRRNLTKMGEIAAYEISKTLSYMEQEVETPFGTAQVALPEQNVVIAAVLRAGLPIHEGLLNILDYASSAFISTYRKHRNDGTFKVKLEYLTSPKTHDACLIIADPMIATGSTIHETLVAMEEYGEPREIHIVTAIASQQGLDFLRRMHPKIHIWTGAVDDELTAKSYIVPGLGDAGDLCFGEKQMEDL